MSENQRQNVLWFTPDAFQFCSLLLYSTLINGTPGIWVPQVIRSNKNMRREEEYGGVGEEEISSKNQTDMKQIKRRKNKFWYNSQGQWGMTATMHQGGSRRGLRCQRKREVIHRSIKGHWLHTTYCSLFLHLQSYLSHPTPDLMKGPFLWNRTHLEYENGFVYLSNGECLKSRRARYTAPVTF